MLWKGTSSYGNNTSARPFWSTGVEPKHQMKLKVNQWRSLFLRYEVFLHKTGHLSHSEAEALMKEYLTYPCGNIDSWTHVYVIRVNSAGSLQFTLSHNKYVLPARWGLWQTVSPAHLEGDRGNHRSESGRLRLKKAWKWNYNFSRPLISFPALRL